MPEVAALQKHPCPECGGDAVWNPAKKALVCPYCGTIVPATLKLDGSGIEEHDLAQALRDIPDDQRGWQEKKIAVKCQSCQAISIFDPGRAAQRCEFCGSPEIAPYEETKDPITPESLLPFVLSENQVRDALRAWYGNRWFAPNQLKSGALTDTVKGVYLPYWTFDARADASWTAESGYYYTETETYRDSNGETQTRQVQKIRWEPSSGQLEHFFDDTLIPGSVGVGHDLLAGIEPFPTRSELKPYDPVFLRGFIVERYQIDLGRAAEQSEHKMDAEVRALCDREVPGDTHRSLSVETEYSDRTFKHILLAIWLLTYTYGSKSFQVIVNGYTGVIAGQRPYSWVKIFFAVLAGIIVAVILFVLFQRH
ncbi:MAG TPA: zinc ribbon domain-containing protein [Verrucomicrobiae bacterium]